MCFHHYCDIMLAVVLACAFSIQDLVASCREGLYVQHRDCVSLLSGVRLDLQWGLSRYLFGRSAGIRVFQLAVLKT